MEFYTIIVFIIALMVWRWFFRYRTITLTSPIFRNTETKEIGAWGYYKMRIPCFPYAGLILHDGKGGVYRILEVQWDKAEREITCRTYADQPYCNNDEEQYEHFKKANEESGWKHREVKPHILHWWKDEYENIDIAGDYKV